MKRIIRRSVATLTFLPLAIVISITIRGCFWNDLYESDDGSDLFFAHVEHDLIFGGSGLPQRHDFASGSHEFHHEVIDASSLRLPLPRWVYTLYDQRPGCQQNDLYTYMSGQLTAGGDPPAGPNYWVFNVSGDWTFLLVTLLLPLSWIGYRIFKAVRSSSPLDKDDWYGLRL